MKFDDVFEAAESLLGGQKNVASALSITDGEYSKKRAGTIGMKPPEIDTLLNIASLSICDVNTVETYRSMIEILMKEAKR